MCGCERALSVYIGAQEYVYAWSVYIDAYKHTVCVGQKTSSFANFVHQDSMSQ